MENVPSPMFARRRQVTFRPAAEDDLESISRYGLEAWGEAHSDEYIERITGVLESLAMFPRMGTVHVDLSPDIRSIGVGHHRIFYQVENDRVIVVRILHERMDEDVAVGSTS